MKIKRAAPFEERYMPVPESGCWLWLAGATGAGYGTYSPPGRPQMLAHRYSFEKHMRPLRPGEVVMHTCDVPACVNPAHLRAGTHQDNAHDMINKGRDRLIGERAGKAKLTEAEVRQIRKDNRTLARIAADYGVDLSHIGKIKRRTSWKHI